VHKEADGYEGRLREINKLLDHLKETVSSMFQRMGCDPRPILEMLGNEAGISTKNLMMYLGLIEQRTTELLSIITFMHSKVSSIVT